MLDKSERIFTLFKKWYKFKQGQKMSPSVNYHQKQTFYLWRNQRVECMDAFDHDKSRKIHFAGDELQSLTHSKSGGSEH
jgi:hypothetical protein